ncbi:MAG: AAA family ATPase [Desulfobulbaceae bacterium]|nr:AAA family ATPase [Desulfobulbaceae bacterium]
MRIKRLDLKAFGPFTDQTLDFDSTDPGLHIVYGQNEAGKSSSLRALHTLLYGFDNRTTDNFLHPNPKLLVGGCLCNEDGGELSFVRRKKKKADILDENGEVVDAGVLVSFLQGLTPAVFRSLYAIDYESLIQGGEDILEQKGEVGEAIFSAGSGLGALQETISSMTLEAEKLFKPQGSTPEINRAIKEYNDLKKKIKSISLNYRDWQEHKKSLDSAELKLSEVERKRNECDKRMRHLERLRRIKPQFALRKKLLSDRNALGDVILLAEDFSEQRQKLEKFLQSAREKKVYGQERLENLKQKLGNITVNEQILHQADLLENLNQRLGEYKKGKNDHPRLDGMRINLRREAADLLQHIPGAYTLDTVAGLRPVRVKRKYILNLADTCHRAEQKFFDTKEQYNESFRQLQSIRQTLAAHPAGMPLERLQHAVTLARKVGDIDGVAAQKKLQLHKSRDVIRNNLKQLGLWEGNAAQVEEVVFPLPETVERFEKIFYESDEELRVIRQSLTKSREELQQTKNRLQQIQASGEVPTEEDLLQSRAEREGLWQLLRRRWSAGEESNMENISGEDDDVLVSYEKFVSLSDQIADRLRREAEKVHRFIELQSRLQQNAELVEDLKIQEENAVTRRENITGLWQAEWTSSGVNPLSPKEMMAWLARFEKIRHAAADAREIENEIRSLEEEIRGKRKLLMAALGDFKEVDVQASAGLEPLLLVAESVLSQQSEARLKRENIQEKEKLAHDNVNALHDRLKQAETNVGQVKQAWNVLLDELELPHIGPAEAADFLETLRECFDKLKQAEDLRKRIEGIIRDQQRFREDVFSAADLVGFKGQSDDAGQVVVRLHGALNEARESNTLRKQCVEQIEQAEKEEADAERNLQKASEEFNLLCRKAKCANSEELERAEKLSAQLKTYNEKLAAIDETLVQMADGIDLDELESQCREVDPDELPAQIDVLARKIAQEFEPQKKDLSQLIGREKKELEQMDGSAEAAQMAEMAEQQLARIGRLTGKYVRLKVAAQVLADEIERYREENQDPVLQIASEYFSMLTLRSFNGLRTDEDDKRRPILVGSREDGSRVEVKQMSSGTRDQLYLALRLASLKWRHRMNEPLPFIVDDILINFDDERTSVTLQILSELAEKNQIILFTHHRQVLQSALEIKGSERVHVHQLQSGEESALSHFTV